MLIKLEAKSFMNFEFKKFKIIILIKSNNLPSMFDESKAGNL